MFDERRFSAGRKTENAVLINQSTDGTNTYDVYFTHVVIGGSDNLVRIIVKNGGAVSVDALAYNASTTKGNHSLVTKNSAVPTRGSKFGGDIITIANPYGICYHRAKAEYIAQNNIKHIYHPYFQIILCCR